MFEISIWQFEAAFAAETSSWSERPVGSATGELLLRDRIDRLPPSDCPGAGSPSSSTMTFSMRLMISLDTDSRVPDGALTRIVNCPASTGGKSSRPVRCVTHSAATNSADRDSQHRPTSFGAPPGAGRDSRGANHVAWSSTDGLGKSRWRGRCLGSIPDALSIRRAGDLSTHQLRRRHGHEKDRNQI